MRNYSESIRFNVQTSAQNGATTTQFESDRVLMLMLAGVSRYLTLCGVETLPLRMERHVANATAVANFLSTHPAVAWVSHASQPSSPYHKRVEQYCPAGAGAVFTIGLHGGT
jgi:O-acetylhomoserine/O-acetylserine sulfhydrylase-like pyridoxal-dependent enzyme